MITVHVRLFAGHRDIVGATTLDLQLPPGATVGDAWAALVAAHPRLAGYTGRLLYAVNQEFSQPASPLTNGDELAFIPPVSGG